MKLQLSFSLCVVPLILNFFQIIRKLNPDKEIASRTYFRLSLTLPSPLPSYIPCYVQYSTPTERLTTHSVTQHLKCDLNYKLQFLSSANIFFQLIKRIVHVISCSYFVRDGLSCIYLLTKYLDRIKNVNNVSDVGSTNA